VPSSQYRAEIAPGGVFSHTFTHADRPIGGLSFERGRRVVIARLQDLLSHIREREVVDWHAPIFL